MQRKGFVLGGTLIVDEVKIIDTYPREGTLVKILASSKGVGGCPTNNSINLKTLDPVIPVAVVGRIGDDEKGRYVLERLREKGVDTHAVTISTEKPTSYTDVMTAKDSGQRTFFHDVGANAEWTVAHIPFEDFAGYKIAQIGYILLLDGMDAVDPEYGTVMARAFARFQQMGLKTTVDVVSEMSDRFTRLVTPALQYVDYLILNEIEAGQTVGILLRDDARKLRGERLREVAEKLLAAGKSELVVIHMPEGGYALSRSGQEVKCPSYQISEQEIQGSVGAGDAFCSGVLYGLEQEQPLEECLQLGTTLAACNLFSPTATGGALSLAAAQEKMRDRPLRPLTF
ncbi:PfkB domain protein [Candidatus Moduliflexus flocculans]|uniref:PfkB domain protein n=1 Tax=Candidatus Moduliflexus flocculans TaxID=1499966 RepID=A0A081BNZ2_9BACT|nr:PfkB domain protein [Candidatus Moduliflexus flocculans]